ncbi:MAG: hypothetical protein J6I73_10065 [Treponema sp.]|nr:hypothetical protein [Treponema sp.]
MAAVVIILLIIIALYLFAIAPRMFGKPDTRAFEHILYAHRGLFDNEAQHPENSLAAFKRALEAGYGIETDVRLSKDGVPVLHHDATLLRSCGIDGNVCDYTYEELQAFRLFKSNETIPRLSDFLELVAGSVPLIIEYKLEAGEKAEPLCNTVNSILETYGGSYCIESFNSWVLRWYKKHNPRIVRGQLAENYLKTGVKMNRVLLFTLQNLLINFLTRPDFIAYNYEFRNAFSFRMCRLLGALPVAWTIKNREQLETAKEIYRAYIFDSFMP